MTPYNEEQCDDGGNESGDGCDPFCQAEPGYVCNRDGVPGCHQVTCGDGYVDWPYEDCEGGEFCGADCRIDSGYLCDYEGTCEARAAGDLCNNAEMLPYGEAFTNSYDLGAMTSDDLNCSGCELTQWFAVEQQPGDGFVTPERRGGQRRLPAVVGQPGVGAVSQQRSGQRRVAVVAGQHQQAVALAVAQVRHQAHPQQARQPVRVACPHELEQLEGERMGLLVQFRWRRHPGRCFAGHRDLHRLA